MNVFVSYQRADTLFAAHALAYALRLRGHEAFIDTGDIGAGQLYRDAIANAVGTSHVLLALIGLRGAAAGRAVERGELRMAARALPRRFGGTGAGRRWRHAER